MVKRALIFIVVLYAISITMNSCRCGYYTEYIQFHNLRLFIIDIEQGIMISDENMDMPIAKANLGIEPDLWAKVAFQRPRPRPRGFISEAQGMWSCWHPQELAHYLASIAIIAKSENSEGYQVEIDVTSSFSVMFGFFEWEEEEIISIDELVYEFHTHTRSSRYAFFLSDDSIDLTGRQTFEIIFTFDDGIVLTQKTEELTLI